MTLTALMWTAEVISAAVVLAVWRFRGSPGILVALAGAVTILILHGYFLWDYNPDDAFISFRYAHNLAHGNGLVWNPGERVEGYSNFLWVLLLAGTELAGLGIVEPSRWLGFAASVGALVVVYGMARELAPDRRQAELTFAATALLTVSAAPFSLWTFSGLEEPLFSFLVALTLYLHITEERRDESLPWSAAAAFAASLTRPEGLIVAALVFALKAATLARAQKIGSGWSRLAAWAACFGLPYAAFIGWRLAYYGYPLPNTYYQKLDGQGIWNPERFREGFFYVKDFWQQYGLIILFPLPLAALCFRASRRAATPLLAFAAVWIAYVIYAGGDFLEFFRFTSPVLPIAYLLSVHALVAGVHGLPRGWGRRVATALLPLGALATIAWVMHVPKEDFNGPSFWEAIAFQREDIANWIRTQDPSALVAVNAAGQIPYWTDGPSLDTLGLTDEHIAHQPPYTSGGYLIPGHKKGDGRYVLDRRPDLIIVSAGLTLLPQSSFAWRTLNANLPADNDLLGQPDLWDLYEPAWVKVPRGVFNFLRLKSSDKVKADPSPPLSESEALGLRAREPTGSCDNWILPRPPPSIDYGYFYLTRWGAVDGPTRRAVTEYRSDAPASPEKVIDLYERYMDQSRWNLDGVRRDPPQPGAGQAYTIATFHTGQAPGEQRTASVAISDNGQDLITSVDFLGTESPSFFYRC